MVPTYNVVIYCAFALSVLMNWKTFNEKYKFDQIFPSNGDNFPVTFLKKIKFSEKSKYAATRQVVKKLKTINT